MYIWSVCEFEPEIFINSLLSFEMASVEEKDDEKATSQSSAEWQEFLDAALVTDATYKTVPEDVFKVHAPAIRKAAQSIQDAIVVNAREGGNKHTITERLALLGVAVETAKAAAKRSNGIYINAAHADINAALRLVDEAKDLDDYQELVVLVQGAKDKAIVALIAPWRQ